MTIPKGIWILSAALLVPASSVVVGGTGPGLMRTEPDTAQHVAAPDGLLRQNKAELTDATPALLIELDTLSNKDLRKHALDLGVDDDKLDEALDASDIRAALMDLILKAQPREDGNHQTGDSERALLSIRGSNGSPGGVTTIECDTGKKCKDKKIPVPQSYTVVRCIGKDACSGNTQIQQENGAKHVLIVCDGENSCSDNFKLKPGNELDGFDWTVSCYGGKNVCGGRQQFGRAETCKGPLCPTTLAGVSAYVIPSDTRDCMSKILCFDKLPVNVQNNNAFKCECVWRSGAQSDDPMCDTYNQCLNSQSGEDGLMAQAEKNIQAAVFGNQAANGQSLLQTASNFTRNQKDLPGCVDPFTTSIEQLTCSCWDHLRKECEEQQGDAQVKCWRNLMCTHKAICRSWQTSYCTKAERRSAVRKQKQSAEAQKELIQDDAMKSSSSASAAMLMESSTHSVQESEEESDAGGSIVRNLDETLNDKCVNGR